MENKIMIKRALLIAALLLLFFIIAQKFSSLEFSFFQKKPAVQMIPDGLHKNVTVTVFWVGEGASFGNSFISNSASTWDSQWEEHYGGLDSPENRDSFYPADFIPKENPFYFALPYNDFDSGGERKEEAYDFIPWANSKQWDEDESMCKNQWIMIRKGEKTAYAQWEDAGPYGEDDGAYVFGNAEPENGKNKNAGLDVSPAVRDYLGLGGIDAVDWKFVDFKEVPDGPWRQIITTSQIF